MTQLEKFTGELLAGIAQAERGGTHVLFNGEKSELPSHWVTPNGPLSQETLVSDFAERLLSAAQTGQPDVPAIIQATESMEATETIDEIAERRLEELLAAIEQLSTEISGPKPVERPDYDEDPLSLLRAEEYHTELKGSFRIIDHNGYEHLLNASGLLQILKEAEDYIRSFLAGDRDSNPEYGNNPFTNFANLANLVRAWIQPLRQLPSFRGHSNGIAEYSKETVDYTAQRTRSRAQVILLDRFLT